MSENKTNDNKIDVQPVTDNTIESLKKDIEMYKKLMLEGDEEEDLDRKYDDVMVDLGKEVLDIIDKNSDRYFPYLILSEWSDIVKEKKLLFLCPNKFADTFIFLPKTCFFRSFIIPNANRNDCSAIDMGVFRDTHIFKIKECNYTMAQDDNAKQKGEIFDLDMVDAKIAYVIRESNKKLQTYENLYLDSQEMNSRYDSLWDSFKVVKKKFIRETSENEALNKEMQKIAPKVNWKNPPKEYQGITMLGWGLTILFFIFWLINFKI